eukprot:9328703-Pyramimonas_sp.AAC.1
MHGRGGPLCAKVVQSKWRPPPRRLQRGPALRAWMAALRWGVHCRGAKAHVAKSVDKILIWQDGCRIVKVRVDLSQLTEVLVDLVRFMRGVRVR